MTNSGQRQPAPIHSTYSPILQPEVARLQWMNYVQEIFWRAGNYNSMEKVLDIVNEIKVPTDTQGKIEFQQIRNKVQTRLAKVLKVLPRKQNREPFVSQCTDSLLRRGFPEARAFFRLNAAKSVKSTQKISEDLKALIISLRMIKFDARHNRPKVPLWESYMRYNSDQKMEIMNFVKDAQKGLTTGTPQSWSVKARLAIILGEDVHKYLSIPELAADPVESNLLKGYSRLQQNDHCGALAGFTKALQSASAEVVRKVIGKKILVEKPKCVLGEKTKTFDSFCQRQPGTEFPISAATRSDANASEIAKLERMFWTAVWASDCKVAQNELESLQTILGSKLTLDQFIVKKMPEMQAAIQNCLPTENVTFQSTLGQQVLQRMKQGDAEVALGIASASVDRKLYLAALLHLYPRAAYSPCLGGSVISGNMDADIRLLEKVHKIQKNQPRETCKIDDNECKFTSVQAYYILGNLIKAKEAAASIDPKNPHCKTCVQILACLELCSVDKDPKLACKVKQHLAQLGPEALTKPNLKIARALVQGLDKAPIRSPNMKKENPLDYIFSDIRNDIGRPKALFNPVNEQPKSSIPGRSSPTTPDLTADVAPKIDIADIPMPSNKPAAPIVGSCGPKAIPLPNQVVPPGQCPLMVVPPTNPDGSIAPFVTSNCPMVTNAQSCGCSGAANASPSPCQAAQQSSACPCQVAQPAPSCPLGSTQPIAPPQPAQQSNQTSTALPPCQQVVVSPQGTPLCGLAPPVSPSSTAASPRQAPNVQAESPSGQAPNQGTEAAARRNPQPFPSTPALTPKQECAENARLLRIQLDDMVKKFTEGCGKKKEEIISQGGTPITNQDVLDQASQVAQDPKASMSEAQGQADDATSADATVESIESSSNTQSASAPTSPRPAAAPTSQVQPKPKSRIAPLRKVASTVLAKSRAAKATPVNV